jgi:hypothetical protein
MTASRLELERNDRPMNKRLRPLSLHRETIRTLSAASLTRVGGAGYTDADTTCTTRDPLCRPADTWLSCKLNYGR